MGIAPIAANKFHYKRKIVKISLILINKMKLTISLAGVLCCIIASSCYAQSNNLILGAASWNDTRILYQHVNFNSSMLQVTTREVAFPSAVSIFKLLFWIFYQVGSHGEHLKTIDSFNS